MLNDINIITKSIYIKDNPGDVDTQEMMQMIDRYPYFAPARLLLAKKRFDGGEAGASDLVMAGLYVHNPLALDWILRLEPAGPVIAPQEDQTVDEKQPLQSGDESPIVFQSYHTIDYFASQGIRLQQAELTKDKLGQQLKSFTEWLRSMKKLPASEAAAATGTDDPQRHYHVMQSAAHSIEAKEILTETMAEVWVKQGHPEKAVAIYEKLSLQNPGKSGYFAAKIDQLKAL